MTRFRLNIFRMIPQSLLPDVLLDKISYQVYYKKRTTFQRVFTLLSIYKKDDFDLEFVIEISKAIKYHIITFDKICIICSAFKNLFNSFPVSFLDYTSQTGKISLKFSFSLLDRASHHLFF